MTSTVNQSLTFSQICVEAVLEHFEYRHKVPYLYYHKNHPQN